MGNDTSTTNRKRPFAQQATFDDDSEDDESIRASPINPNPFQQPYTLLPMEQANEHA